MDQSVPDIEFDENGECNLCKYYDELVRRRVYTGVEGERRLNQIVAEIKNRGKNDKYDCIIGLSGGLDSTYAAHLAVKLGLRPLVVSVDNGWDDDIARHNVQQCVEKLGLELYRYVIDWAEYNDLQLAYFKASVIDIEAITDHAVVATLYQVADKKGIKYIIIGINIATESPMPASWSYNKNDLTNLRSIHKRFGTVKLKNFPTLGLGRGLYYKYLKKINQVPILNFVPYVRDEAKQIVSEELGWRDYGRKHYESVFTRFYQTYILPKKFGVDKRRGHLSAVVRSGQMTRQAALEEMKEELYPETDFIRDRDYILNKIGLTTEEFEEIMNLPVKSHFDYGTDIRWRKLLRSAYYRLLRARV
jgi:N-acetyl sugar amidotransferase